MPDKPVNWKDRYKCSKWEIDTGVVGDHFLHAIHLLYINQIG